MFGCAVLEGGLVGQLEPEFGQVLLSDGCLLLEAVYFLAEVSILRG